MGHIPIRELPENERPYEKLMKHGAQSLEDSELIAVLLRSGTEKHSAIEIARSILSHPLVNNNLDALHHLQYSDLRKVSGLGKVRSLQLLAAIEFARRISKAKALTRLAFTKPETIAQYYMEDMRHLTYETVIAAFLNSRGDFLGDKEVFRGSVNASVASPREVFIEAVRHDAVGVVLLHNHPSGDPMPSREDILLTKRLIQAGEVLAIPLVDHIVIGDNRYYSFREKENLY